MPTRCYIALAWRFRPFPSLSATTTSTRPAQTSSHAPPQRRSPAAPASVSAACQYVPRPTSTAVCALTRLLSLLDHCFPVAKPVSHSIPAAFRQTLHRQSLTHALSPTRSFLSLMRFPTDTPSSSLERRADHGGLPTSSIATIAALSGVAALVLARILYQIITRRCRRSRQAAPLPPVQDLAHRREQQLAALSGLHDSRAPSSWLDPSTFSGRSPSQTGSSVSLLTAPEKNASVYTDDGGTAESSTLASPVSFNDKTELQPPNPMFYPPPSGSSPHVSMISSNSGDSSYSSLPGATAISRSSSMAASDAVPPSVSVEGNNTPPRQSRSHGRTRPGDDTRASSRGRPQSQLSLRSSQSGQTLRSTSTARGAPHRPYSGVQIVLPAPLGAQQHPQQPMRTQGQRASVQSLSAGYRTSGFADQWVATSQRNSTISEQSKRKSSSSDSRRSTFHGISSHLAGFDYVCFLQIIIVLPRPRLAGRDTPLPPPLRLTPGVPPCHPLLQAQIVAPTLNTHVHPLHYATRSIALHPLCRASRARIAASPTSPSPPSKSASSVSVRTHLPSRSPHPALSLGRHLRPGNAPQAHHRDPALSRNRRRRARNFRNSGIPSGSATTSLPLPDTGFPPSTRDVSYTMERTNHHTY